MTRSVESARPAKRVAPRSHFLAPASRAFLKPGSRASRRTGRVRALLDPLPSAPRPGLFGRRLSRLFRLTWPSPSHHDLPATPTAIRATDAAVGTDAKILRAVPAQRANFHGFLGPDGGTAIARSGGDGRQSPATGWCVGRAEAVWSSSARGSLRRISRCAQSARQSWP